MGVTGGSSVAYRLPWYEGICPLGSGGMAEVHLARTRTTPPALVAIKALLPELRGEPDRAEMLADEVRVGLLLRHPNIVRVFDAGIAEGEPYIAMEYVDGPSLREMAALDHARSSSVDLDLAITVGVGVCDGLRYAHLATDAEGRPLGLVHRDVTPQNLMITGAGLPKLLDFGVARAAGRRHATEGRAVKGKIAYAAPEYISGQVPDARADVFSLGAVLWEAVTGRRLFGGGSLAETVRAVLHGPVPAPSIFNPAVPPTLDEAIRGALARPVGARWHSAAELRDALYLAATAVGGVLSPSEIACRIAARYPTVSGEARVLDPLMSREEISSRASFIRTSVDGLDEWGHAPLDTALEVDIDPAAFEPREMDSEPSLQIPEDLMADD